MKRPEKKDGRPGPHPLKIKRHYTTLTAKETDALEEAVVDLIVNYVQKKGGDPVKAPDPEPAEKPDTEQPRAGGTSKKKRKGCR